MAEELTIEEMRKLPLRAIVAFAARCARRVQPLFNAWGNDEEIVAIEEAIEAAEQYATGVAVRSAIRASKASSIAYRTHSAATDAAAAAAADAATYSAYTVDVGSFDPSHYEYHKDAAIRVARAVSSAARDASAAYYAARDAAYYAARDADARDARDAHDAAARSDYERLHSLFAGEDYAVVPEDFFGLLWSDGEPREWQEAIERIRKARRGHDILQAHDNIEKSQPEHLVSAIFDGSDEWSQDQIDAAINYLSVLYQEHGGTGLKLIDEPQGYASSYVREKVT